MAATMSMMASTAMAISSTVRFLSVSSASLKNDIRQIDNRFFWLLIGCTFLVLLGVILEEIKFRADRSYVDEETGTFIPSRSQSLAKIGLWILVVGIAGEGLFEAATFWVDTLSEDFSNSLLLNAEALTGNAAKSAKSAHDLGIDLLEKYKTAERERLKLEAEKLPRRLSTGQKAKFVKRVAAFKTKTISLTCGIGSASEAPEALDFELDFFAALSANLVNPVIKVDSYNTSCNMFLWTITKPIPPVQVEYGLQRQGDALILVKALEEIGIKKRDIVTNTSVESLVLILAIGPKPR